MRIILKKQFIKDLEFAAGMKLNKQVISLIKALMQISYLNGAIKGSENTEKMIVKYLNNKSHNGYPG